MAISRTMFKILDAKGAASNVEFTGIEVTGANYVAQQLASSALATALDGVTLGLVKKQTRIAYEVQFAGEKSTNLVARRELKWLVHFHYVGTTRKGTLEIPCPDPTQSLVGNEDRANLESDEWSDFVTAFEAYEAYTDDAGDPHFAVIDYVEMAGRNI